MSLLVLNKLLAIFVTVALGWVAGRMRWLGEASGGTDPARTMANATFFIFVPALLFRTTARLDLAAMPWRTVAAYYTPVLAMLLGAYAIARWRGRHDAGADLAAGEQAAAGPSVRAIQLSFGNGVQIGIPTVTALFGEPGLAVLVTLISLHALLLLSVLTALVETDLARMRSRHDASAGLWRTLRATVRNTLIHPVVLPVLAGMAWQLTGWRLPGPVDETLQLLATGVAPLALVLIGISLAYYGARSAIGRSAVMALGKLLALPAAVLVVAHWGFGLSGLPLSVVVTMAALPCGSNALIFAQRYASHEAETTAAIVLSTLGFVLTAPLWLAVLAWVG